MRAAGDDRADGSNFGRHPADILACPPQRELLLAATAALACAPFPAEPVYRLEEELGGPGAVLELLSTGSDAEVRRTLAPHGIAYKVHADIIGIETCPQYFSAEDREAWHALTGEYYYIDAAGRPSRTYSFIPPIEGEARMNACQGQVGRWGDKEVPGHDHDGGHLIGSSSVVGVRA